MNSNKKIKEIISSVIIGIICIILVTIISFLFKSINFPETTIVILYLLAVLLTACFTNRYIYGIIISIVATFTFNYFFAAPYLTFSVYDPIYIITFIIMTGTSFIVSILTIKVKKNALDAQEKERETKILFSLTSRLTDAKDIEQITETSIDTISHMLKYDIACLYFDENGNPNKYFIQKTGDTHINKEVSNIKKLKKDILNLKDEYLLGDEFHDYPIYGKENILGIVRIPNAKANQLTDVQVRLLHSMIESTALAIDSLYSENQKIKLHEEANQERYRGNLLRSISHDLRTPISGIMGTSQMIMDITNHDDARYSMIEGIYKDANWLYSLVENILSLTRLQDDYVSINKRPEAIEEIIGCAINRTSKHYPNFDISVSVPNECLLVPMDAKLIEQVLINLLDNAIKHSTNIYAIHIIAKKDELNNQAVVKVIDNGEGISEKDLANIFQTFYTTDLKHSDAKKGIGLGLSICEAVITAHNGTIFAKNRTSTHGAEFIFTLPLEVKSNEQ